MKNGTTANLERINSLRRNALLSWLKTENLEVPEGWSVSNANIEEIVNLFTPLRIRSGYKLVGFQFREEDSGNGRVVALPADRDATSFIKDNELHLPEQFQGDAMNAIEGDDSPWSYLAASILLRELKELGAFGHGAEWMDHQILDNEIWNSESATLTSYLGESIPWTNSGWIWHGDRPTDMDPSIEFDEGQVLITFYSYYGRFTPKITRHIDVYKRELHARP